VLLGSGILPFGVCGLFTAANAVINQQWPRPCWLLAGAWDFVWQRRTSAPAAIRKNRARMERRSKGAEERSPIGLTAAPRILPEIYGDTATGSALFHRNLKTTFWKSGRVCRRVATLLVAPLAWCSRRHRAINAFWLFLALFGVSWGLGIPGFVNAAPAGMNMMSHNASPF
jgi:hypothetical protein